MEPGFANDVLRTRSIRVRCGYIVPLGDVSAILRAHDSVNDIHTKIGLVVCNHIPNLIGGRRTGDHQISRPIGGQHTDTLHNYIAGFAAQLVRRQKCPQKKSQHKQHQAGKVSYEFIGVHIK